MAPPLLLLRDIHLTFGGMPLLEGLNYPFQQENGSASWGVTARANRRS